MAVTTTGLILAAQGVQGAAGVAGAYNRASALKAQGGHEESISNWNASQLDAQARDAISLGDSAAARVRGGDVSRMVAKQRTAAAGQGVDVSHGSAAQGQASSAAMGALDALTIRNNAAREALGFKGQAIGERYKGRLSRISGDTEARGSMISGGMGLAKELMGMAQTWKEDPYFYESSRPPKESDRSFVESFGADYKRSKK
jgi:hypothetical protein